MISFKNVSYSFQKGIGVQDVNLSVNKGEFTFMIGPTGSGKTTLMRLIYMDLFPDKGIVTVNKFSSNKLKKRKIPQLRREIGMIFQDYHLLPDRSLLANIALPLHVIGYHRNDIDSMVKEIIEQVGLTGKESHYPNELSGGEQQRACIARALIKEPKIILADEPTGNLDPVTSHDIIAMLEDINKQGTAILMASHNYNLIKGRGHRFIQMQKGRLSVE